MSLESVKELLTSKGFGERLQEFDVSSATVALAAQALGCEEAHIAKTLSFLVNGAPVLVVTAGDTKADNRKFKDFFHTKAVMIPREMTEELTGHAAGGCCPFAVKEGVQVYLDESLKRFDIIYPAAGSSNSAVRLTPAELEQLAAPVQWVDVCKPIETV